MVGRQPYCFASGIAAGRLALEALCEAGMAPTLALGYDTTLAGRAGFASLSDLATASAFELVETSDINGAAVREAIERVSPVLLVVAGWSQIVRSDVLARFPLGGIGIHPTALPTGRGRAPIPWTLLKGMTATAVTLFHLADDADTGDIIARVPIAVSRRDDAASLYEKIAEAHATVLLQYLPAVLEGRAPREKQGSGGETWPRRRPEDGLIDWTLDSGRVYDWIRGLTHPYPGAFTNHEGRRLTIWSADEAPDWDPAGALPGMVLGPVWSPSGGGLAVATGKGVVIIRAVDMEDSAMVDALGVLEAGQVRPGDLLG